MRALTIQNPYPHLIVTPQIELPPGAKQKRVENRVWECKRRETIAIHAGLSMKWFQFNDYPCPDGKLKPAMFPEMAFGAIVGMATISDCVHIDSVIEGDLPEHLNWLESHEHASGPFCIVLSHVWRLDTPVPCTGKLGLWTLSEEVDRLVCDTKLIPVPFTVAV